MKKKRVKAQKRKSIKTKITAFVIILSIVPTLIFGAVAYLNSFSVLKDKTNNFSKNYLSMSKKSVDNSIDTYRSYLDMMASNVNFTDLEMHPDYESFTTYLLKNVQESNKEIRNINYGTVSKKFLSYPKQSVSADYDPTSRDWYKQAASSKGKVVVTEPYKDAVTGEYVISVVKAVENNGSVVGVIAIDVNLKAFADKISSFKVSDNNRMIIADKNGLILADTDKQQMFTDGAKKLAVWSNVVNKKSGQETFSMNGTSMDVSYDTDENTGWKLISIFDRKEYMSGTQKITYAIIILIAVMAILGVLLSLGISKYVMKLINKIIDVMKSTAMGDFTRRITVTTNDEFKDLADGFNNTLDEVSSLIKDISKSSEIVLEASNSLETMSSETATSIQQVASTMEEISRGTVETATTMEVQNESMGVLAAQMDAIAKSTINMESVSNDTKNLGSDGLGVINDLRDKSNNTLEASEVVNGIIMQVNESTKKVSSITETISSITEQTNLLALNAAIEAARAGESGRGFSVVADEIRKLAEQSKSSADEITIIVSNIEERVGQAVQAMSESQEVINSQYDVVNESQRIFNSIINGVNTLADEVRSINEAVADMNQNKQEVVGQIESVSAISEETAAGTEEVSASVQEVNATVEELGRYVGKLKELSVNLHDNISKFRY